jgi:hypothetical protein
VERIDLGDFPFEVVARDDIAPGKVYMGSGAAALRPSPLGFLTDGGLAEAGFKLIGTVSPEDPLRLKEQE